MTKSPLTKEEQKRIAKERIITLFKEAQEQFSKKPDLSHRYIDLARKIAMKVKIKIPPHLKRRFCKHCYKYLQPGINARIRTRDSKVIISCLECKKFTRIPLKPKRTKEKRREKSPKKNTTSS